MVMYRSPNENMNIIEDYLLSNNLIFLSEGIQLKFLVAFSLY